MGEDEVGVVVEGRASGDVNGGGKAATIGGDGQETQLPSIPVACCMYVSELTALNCAHRLLGSVACSSSAHAGRCQTPNRTGSRDLLITRLLSPVRQRGMPDDRDPLPLE